LVSRALRVNSEELDSQVLKVPQVHLDQQVYKAILVCKVVLATEDSPVSLGVLEVLASLELKAKLANLVTQVSQEAKDLLGSRVTKALPETLARQEILEQQAKLVLQVFRVRQVQLEHREAQVCPAALGCLVQPARKVSWVTQVPWTSQLQEEVLDCRVIKEILAPLD